MAYVPLSKADMDALDALTACHIETNKAVQELARAIARDHGIELAEPQSDRPRPKNRHLPTWSGTGTEILPEPWNMPTDG